jgi:hypothetical protein
VPEYEHDEVRLSPARLSPNEFREIESALGAEYKDVTTWDFYRGSRNHSSPNLDEVLSEMEGMPAPRSFKVNAEDDDSSITVYGDDDGCWLDYTCTKERTGSTREKVRIIKSIFRDHRRYSNYLPNWPPAFRRPTLDIGERFTVQLSRDEIIQGIITRSVSNGLTALVAFGLGLLAGWRIF